MGCRIGRRTRAVVMDEARECAGFDAYCSCDEPMFKFSKEGVSVSLSDDCYPHAALGCTPTLERGATLTEVDSLLTGQTRVTAELRGRKRIFDVRFSGDSLAPISANVFLPCKLAL